MDPWQRDDFASLDPALLRCTGRVGIGCPSCARLWEENCELRRKLKALEERTAVRSVQEETNPIRPIEGLRAEV
jgi:hypothetical protein